MNCVSLSPTQKGTQPFPPLRTCPRELNIGAVQLMPDAVIFSPSEGSWERQCYPKGTFITAPSHRAVTAREEQYTTTTSSNPQLQCYREPLFQRAFTSPCQCLLKADTGSKAIKSKAGLIHRNTKEKENPNLPISCKSGREAAGMFSS